MGRHIKCDDGILIGPIFHHTVVLAGLAARCVQSNDRALGIVGTVVGLIVSLNSVYVNVSASNRHFTLPPLP